jgi:Ca-activated chloride channel family protein
MYQIEEKIWFWLFLIPLVISIIFIINEIWKQKIQKQFFTSRSLNKLSPLRSKSKPKLKLLICLFSITFIIISLSNPQIGTKVETYKRFGTDIVFAIDVSKSMLAEDIVPNRLEKSKQIVTQIINNLKSDRVGIVAYAGKAFPQLPITTDYSSAKMFLNNMNTDMISSQGTAIDEAIQLSTNYFDEDQNSSKILFIISDGEDHNNNSNDISKFAAKKGISIYTIGVGKEKGAPIPIKNNGVIQNYKRDNNNEVVITKLNTEMLQNISESAGGYYINGEITSKVIDEVNTILLNTEKKEFESKQFSGFEDQFQWFIIISLILILLDTIIFNSKTKWISKLNLFNDGN